mmetsp:Transcript_631/g.1454  ORF Transcript_631/g.1454 Transcript_631/m.1454 type:complete len:350 (+) Transcript_631:144-1193(+)
MSVLLPLAPAAPAPAPALVEVFPLLDLAGVRVLGILVVVVAVSLLRLVCHGFHFHCSMPLRVSHTFRQQHHLLLLRREELHLFLCQCLNSLKAFHIVLGDKCDGAACVACARRAANTVDVVLRVSGDVVVQHKVNQRNVQAPGGNISCDQDLRALGLEFVEGGQALGLRHGAVQGDGVQAKCAQQKCQPLHRIAGGAEDDCAVARHLIEDEHKVAVLVLCGHKHVVLHQRADGGVFRGHLHFYRVYQRRALQLLDLGGHSGGVKVCGALLWRGLQDGGDFLLEIHVQEAVRLVKHQKLDGLEAESLGVFQMVHQPARCGNNYVWLFCQGDCLLHRVHTTDDHSTAHTDT